MKKHSKSTILGFWPAQGYISLISNSILIENLPFWSCSWPRPTFHCFSMHFLLEIYHFRALAGPGPDFIDFPLTSFGKSIILELWLAQAQISLIFLIDCEFSIRFCWKSTTLQLWLAQAQISFIFNSILMGNLFFLGSGEPRPRLHWFPSSFWLKISHFRALALPGPDFIDFQLNPNWKCTILEI